MSYTKYETNIMSKLGVKLVGWPPGIPFASPSLIGTVGDVRILREALKCGECHWVLLSRREKEEHATKLSEAARSTDPAAKKRKQRSNKGTKRKGKGRSTRTEGGSAEGATTELQGSKRRKHSTAVGAESVGRELPPMQHRSNEYIDDSDEDDE